MSVRVSVVDHDSAPRVEVSTTPAGPAWPRPAYAVEILPHDASTRMYEAWRDARLEGIGGSDIAAVLGLVSWESEYGLWLTKTGARPPVDETPIMTRGRYAELMLGQWFADETGLALRKTGTWAVDGAEHLRCNPDRFTSDGGGVEMKAPDTDDWGDKWKYGPAAHAVAQARWCMAVTGCPHWYVVADGGKDGLKWWRIDRDHDYEQWMVNRADRWWWRHVIDGNPPDVDGSEATTTACKEASSPADQLAAYAEVPGSMEWARRRGDLKGQIKDLQRDLDVVENRFKAALLRAETATDNGVPVLSWAWVSVGTARAHRKFKEPK